jgi:hypothetical protein
MLLHSGRDQRQRPGAAPKPRGGDSAQRTPPRRQRVQLGRFSFGRQGNTREPNATAGGAAVHAMNKETLKSQHGSNDEQGNPRVSMAHAWPLFHSLACIPGSSLKPLFLVT